MAYRQEDTVANIIQSSGVLGGRVPWFPGRDTPSQTTNQPSKETA
jgi:methylenetetrahydrofolate reductase (NADPH)